MIEVKNLKFSYRKKLIFENINFTVNSGEISFCSWFEWFW